MLSLQEKDFRIVGIILNGNLIQGNVVNPKEILPAIYP